jgi:hypothetical protein
MVIQTSGTPLKLAGMMFIERGVVPIEEANPSAIYRRELFASFTRGVRFFHEFHFS